MKRLLLILFIIIIADTYCYAAKEAQPASKNQVVLDLKDEPSIFNKSKELSEGEIEEDSLNLKYTKDLRKDSHETLIYSDNLMNNQTRNEVVMSVKPFKDDRMDVDLGTGQSFSRDNQPAKSQLNLTTKFRF